MEQFQLYVASVFLHVWIWKDVLRWSEDHLVWGSFHRSVRAHLLWTSEDARSSAASWDLPLLMDLALLTAFLGCKTSLLHCCLLSCSLTTASPISIMGFHSYKNLYQLPLCLHVVSQACCWLTRSHWQNAFKCVSCLAFTSWFQNESCINVNSWKRSVLQVGFMPYHWLEWRMQGENFSMSSWSSLLCLWDKVSSVQVLTKDRPVFPQPTAEWCNWACS